MSATEMRTGSDAQSSEPSGDGPRNRSVGELSPAGEDAIPANTESQVVHHRHILLREVNERINEIADGLQLVESFAIHCECGSADCHGRLELTRAEYEHIRRTPTHFALLPGHVTPATERVIQEHERFVTVQMFG